MKSHTGSGRSSGAECRASAACKILLLGFLKKPDAKLEKGTRWFRAIAFMSTLAKWCCKRNPSWWDTGSCTLGRVLYEHMQALSTNLLQRHWEWLEVRKEDWIPGFFKHQILLLTRMDVPTGFDVAKLAVVARK